MGPFNVSRHNAFEGSFHAIASLRTRIHRLEKRFNVEMRRFEWGFKPERSALSIDHIPVVIPPAGPKRVNYTYLLNEPFLTCTRYTRGNLPRS